MLLRHDHALEPWKRYVAGAPRGVRVLRMAGRLRTGAPPLWKDFAAALPTGVRLLRLQCRFDLTHLPVADNGQGHFAAAGVATHVSG